MICTQCDLEIEPGDEIVYVQYGRATMSAKSGQLMLDPTDDPQPYHDSCLVDMAIENGWIDEDLIYNQIRKNVEDDVREEVMKEFEAAGLL
jgi:hypothetical protein